MERVMNALNDAVGRADICIDVPINMARCADSTATVSATSALRSKLRGEAGFKLNAYGCVVHAN